MDPEYIKNIAYRRLRMSQRQATKKELSLIDAEVAKEVMSLSQADKDSLSDRVYGWFSDFYPKEFKSRRPVVTKEAT